MKQKIAFLSAGCILLLLAFALPAQSCVGRILTLSIDNTVEQKLIGQLLATYITERTGTTVNLTTVLDVKASEDLIAQCKADIFLNYIKVGMAGMGDADTTADTQESYSLVKQYYLEKDNMVWLKPLGYKGPLQESAGKGTTGLSLAVPVTTKDVLDRFPVLDRVINKLSGRIDDRTIQRLIQKAQTEGVKVAVKGFLKAQNLI